MLLPGHLPGAGHLARRPVRAAPARSRAGQLVAFYGYAAFLVLPLRTLTEALDKITRGHVAARRVVGLLRARAGVADPAAPAPPPTRPRRAGRPGVRAGRPARPADRARRGRPEDAAAIADRLGRYADPSDVRRWAAYRCSDWTWRRCASGSWCRQRRPAVLRPAARRSSTRTAAPTTRGSRRRWRAASADEIVDALPDGLDARVAERGREFSGGQQQRLRLARALLADPPILVLVEPTSAVDAHTEARIAAPAGAGPARPHHRGLHDQPAGARPRRPGGLRRGRPGRRRGHPPRAAGTAAAATARP